MSSLREQLESAFAEETFEPQETPEVVEEVVDPAPEVSEDSEPTVVEAPAEEEELIAPAHWAKEDREIFQSLDKDGRKFLLKQHKFMESSYTKKMQALTEDQKIAESFKKTITPYESYLNQLQINPTEAFEKLIATEMRLRMASPKEKAAIIHNLAKDYGAEFDPYAEPEQVDEKTQAIYDELNRQKAYIMRWEQQRQEQEKHSLESQINAFASTKDENNKLKYPHFETLRKDMGVLMNAGKADTLEEAYEAALLLNKDLRHEYLLKQSRADDDRKRASASKKAAFNVRAGSNNQITDPKPTLSLRETIARAMEAQSRL